MSISVTLFGGKRNSKSVWQCARASRLLLLSEPLADDCRRVFNKFTPIHGNGHKFRGSLYFKALRCTLHNVGHSKRCTTVCLFNMRLYAAFRVHGEMKNTARWFANYRPHRICCKCWRIRRVKQKTHRLVGLNIISGRIYPLSTYNLRCISSTCCACGWRGGDWPILSICSLFTECASTLEFRWHVAYVTWIDFAPLGFDVNGTQDTVQKYVK